MSYARRIIPGTTYLITRRTEGRRFLFRPDAGVKALFEYCLAEAAERYGCKLHGYCLMSNHLHLVVSDPEGKLPAFMQRLCRHLALGIAKMRGHQGSVFERRSYSAVALETEEAIVDKLAYTHCNPASAHLVDKAAQWPGALSAPAELQGRVRPVKRPQHIGLFKRMQAEVPLRLVAPSSVDGPALASDVAEQVERRHAELSSAPRRRVLGIKRVLSTPWQHAPTTPTPSHERNPRFAAITKDALRRAARNLRAFRKAYREAWLQLAQGVREVLFPFGTWRLCELGLAKANQPPG